MTAGNVTQVDHVNAWGDDDGAVVIALRPEGEITKFSQFRLPAEVADQLMGMLYLLTKEYRA
jgi:hypothetical protein